MDSSALSIFTIHTYLPSKLSSIFSIQICMWFVKSFFYCSGKMVLRAFRRDTMLQMFVLYIQCTIYEFELTFMHINCGSKIVEQIFVIHSFFTTLNKTFIIVDKHKLVWAFKRTVAQHSLSRIYHMYVQSKIDFKIWAVVIKTTMIGFIWWISLIKFKLFTISVHIVKARDV